MAKEVDQVLNEYAGEDEDEANGCQSPGGGVLQRAVWGWTCTACSSHSHGGCCCRLVLGGNLNSMEVERLIT